MECPVCPSVPGSQQGGPQGALLSWARSCLAVPSVQEPWPVRVIQGGHTAESSQHGRCGRQAATRGPRICSSLWPRAVKVAPGRKDEREGRGSVRGQKKCVFSSAIRHLPNGGRLGLALSW